MDESNLKSKNNQITYYVKRALPLINSFKKINLFHKWFNEFEYVADIICVPDNQKEVFFNEVINNKINKRVRRHFPDSNFSEISFKQILDQYLLPFNVTNEKHLHRKRFYCRKQYNEEPTENYAYCLQKIYKKCNYNKINQDKILCKQFMKGIRNNEQREYLNEISIVQYYQLMDEAIEFEKVMAITPYLDNALIIINTYDLSKEGFFHDWLNRFEYAADVIGVPDNKMIEFFNNMVDKYVRCCVRHTFPILNLSELSYEEIENYYLRQFSSKDDDLHLARLNCRKQYIQETIQEYGNKLDKIYRKCLHQQNDRKELIKIFLNGIRDKKISNYLIAYLEDSFDMTVAEANDLEKLEPVTPYLNRALTMIPSYNPNKNGLFHDWLNKFEYIADYIGVPNNLMVEFFKNMVDNDAHEHISEYLPDVNLSTLRYEKIIEHYIIHFADYCETNPHKNRFTSRKQYGREPIEDYAICLRKLYYKCNSSNCLEEELCQQFLHGLHEEQIRTHLSKNPQIPFDEMVKEAVEFAKVNLITYYLNQLQISTFNPKRISFFYDWYNKFEYCVNIIGVPDNKMIQLFFNMVHRDVNETIQNNFLLANITEMSYEDIIGIYLFHFRTRNEKNMHRARFFVRKQYKREPIETYANNLRNIFNRCNYKILYEKLLCEQFVNGINNDDIRKHLSQFANIQFDQMVANAVEFAKVNLITYYVDRALLKIRIYNPRKEGFFHEWLNKFEYVADNIGVPNNKIVEFFNNMVHNDVHKCVKQTFNRVFFLKLSYDEIIDYYLRYFSSNNFSIIDLHKKRLMCRKQYDQETIKTYANNLQKLYQKCYYQDQLETEIIELFVNGIRDVEIRNHLCKIPFVLFNDIVESAMKLEIRA